MCISTFPKDLHAPCITPRISIITDLSIGTCSFKYFCLTTVISAPVSTKNSLCSFINSGTFNRTIDGVVPAVTNLMFAMRLRVSDCDSTAFRQGCSSSEGCDGQLGCLKTCWLVGPTDLS